MEVGYHRTGWGWISENLRFLSFCTPYTILHYHFVLPTPFFIIILYSLHHSSSTGSYSLNNSNLNFCWTSCLPTMIWFGLVWLGAGCPNKHGNWERQLENRLIFQIMTKSWTKSSFKSHVYWVTLYMVNKV